MISQSLHRSWSLTQARTQVKKTVDLALLLETDVLLSLIAASTCITFHQLAHLSWFPSRATAIASWVYMYISISASWAIAGRFLAEHHEWSLSRASAIFFILSPSALGPPIMCATALFYTFPQYNFRYALLHFVFAFVPALLIALFGNTTPDVFASSPKQYTFSSPSPISPSLLLQPALAYRASKPLPMRIAVLRGAKFPAKKPMVHPLVKRRQYRPGSPLKSTYSLGFQLFLHDYVQEESV